MYAVRRKSVSSLNIAENAAQIPQDTVVVVLRVFSVSRAFDNIFESSVKIVGAGVRGLMNVLATVPRCNQEPSTAEDEVRYGSRV